MPKISVVMSAHNHEKFVAQAIESVLNQSFEDFELLIIDDNSTDQTNKIIQKYTDKRIKFFKNNQNYGMVINTNNLIKQALGEYIAIINSDDFWEQNKLKQQLDFLENNPQFGACFTLASMVNEKNRVIKSKKTNPFMLLNLNRWQLLRHLFFNNNFLCYPSVLLRKNLIQEAGYFNPSYLILLDIDMWLKILFLGYEIKILPEKLTNFRILNNGNNISAKSPKTIIRATIECKNILKNFLKIQDYAEFIKIFPEYENQSINNKNLAGFYYLIDYGHKNFFHKTTKKFSDIKNFLIEMIADKSDKDPDLFANLSDHLAINYKEYSAIINQYPHGIDKFKLKNNSKNKKYGFIFVIISFITLFVII